MPRLTVVLAALLLMAARAGAGEPDKLSTRYADPVSGKPIALTVWTPAARPGAADAPVPVAVAAPDFGNKPASLAWLGRGLAERGYLVAIENHPRGQVAYASDAPPGAVWAAWVSRRDAFTAALDAVAALDGWGGVANLDRAAALGHGGGGMGALAAAGAAIDLRRFARYCRQADDPLCEESGGRLRFGGQDPLLFPQADARIAAVAAFSPIGAVLPTKGLDGVKVPVRLYAGTDSPARLRAAERLQAELPDSRLMRRDGLGHGGFAGSAPGDVVESLAAFLDRQLGGS